MFYQDFARLKAQFNNNISACYSLLKDFTQADIYNNAAIMEDPDYFDAYLRKCELYEDTCEYSMAVKMAEWILTKVGDDPEYDYLCEQCELLIEEVECKIPDEEKDKSEFQKAQMELELANAEPSFESLVADAFKQADLTNDYVAYEEQPQQDDD